MNFPVSERKRAWIYRVLLAIGPILVLHGVVTEEEFSLYSAVVAELLGVAMAAGNTSSRKQEPQEH